MADNLEKKRAEALPGCDCQDRVQAEAEGGVMEHFNGLSPAEAERLALVLEEMGEAQHIIGKVLRHGYESTHPNGGPTNREMLERELGDVRWAIATLIISDLDDRAVDTWESMKGGDVLPYLHHQPKPTP